MKTLRRAWIVAGILAGGLLVPLLCSAEPASIQTFSAPPPVHVRSAVTIVDFMPWYAVPDRYFFTGGYYMHLNITEMRIDHVADNSRCTRHNRSFMIAASLSEPIGNELGSGRLELPFASADEFKVSRLAPASVGDYVLHLSNSPVYSPILGLSLTARF